MYGEPEGDRLLLTAKGKPWLRDENEGEKRKKVDAIR
jgi:hypothetical protein